MAPTRALARLGLSGIFINGGLDTYRDPAPRAALARPFIGKLAEFAPALPSDPLRIVRANAVVQVAAGGLLAAGILPRVAATILAGSLVPTTLGGHPFWQIDDPARRSQQRTQFLKNAAILGGLLLVAGGDR
jgi:putative oxidoreductase